MLFPVDFGLLLCLGVAGEGGVGRYLCKLRGVVPVPEHGG